MGRGFDTFMENPYYREQYENAPTDSLKQYFRLTWDKNPFVVGTDYDSSKEDAILSKTKFTKEEVEYLAKYAVGGQMKAFYKKWLKSFD